MVDLEDMFRGAVLDLMGIAHGPVTDIIFYRDGVSEGEYDDIIKHEIGAIERKSSSSMAFDGSFHLLPDIRGYRHGMVDS
jgi:hypothetical protein